MKQVIISIGFDKNGEADFGIAGDIGSLTFDRMQQLRAMIPVAIGTAEDMWRRAKALENPPAQENKVTPP